MKTIDKTLYKLISIARIDKTVKINLCFIIFILHLLASLGFLLVAKYLFSMDFEVDLWGQSVTYDLISLSLSIAIYFRCLYLLKTENL